MPEKWRLLVQSDPGCGAWNMAVDEAVLEATVRGDVPPTLRLYAWEPACLSLGYAQPITDVDHVRLQDRGWDLVRRSTGGRAVLHIDELTYSVCGPGNNRILAGTVLESYNRIASALVEALHLLGLPVQVKESEKKEHRQDEPVCFKIPSSYEITVHGKKLIGSAQARRKRGVLQHGSLPLSGDISRILQVLVYQDEALRSMESVDLLDKATTVKSAFGRNVTWEQAAAAFVAGFSSVLDLDLRTGSLSQQETTRATELTAAKYSHPDWIGKK